VSITIRQANISDWNDLKHIRLKALKCDPQSFGSNVHDESLKTDKEWQKQLTTENGAIFLLFQDSQIIGMTGISLQKDDLSEENTALWGSWLEPDLRGQGISKMMYKARVEWAKEHPTATKIIVLHRETNTASKNAILSQGFTQTHRIDREWPDGKTDKAVFYELKI
jgi:RimJ/RimL family protein N-acetyltransferase